MKEEIQKLIEEYSEGAIFTGKISSDDIIESTITELGVNIPNDYRWFLKTMGKEELVE